MEIFALFAIICCISFTMIIIVFLSTDPDWDEFIKLSEKRDKGIKLTAKEQKKLEKLSNRKLSIKL